MIEFFLPIVMMCVAEDDCRGFTGPAQTTIELCEENLETVGVPQLTARFPTAVLVDTECVAMSGEFVAPEPAEEPAEEL